MKKLLFLGSIFILLGSSCSVFEKSASRNQAVERVTPEHNSRNSLDWNGTYRGIIPCADCPGIKTEITLDNDLNYTLSVQYIGKSDSVYREEGIFSWNEAGSEITLNTAGAEPGITSFFVGENVLIMLDASGKRIEGEFSENYKLFKPALHRDITNKYWKLIELYGEEIRHSDERENAPHIILSIHESRATGHTGCNVFTGSYELNDDKKISFSPLASTRMYCRDVDYEDDFLMMFDRAKSYKKLDDSLHLFDSEDNLLGVFVWEFFNPTPDQL